MRWILFVAGAVLSWGAYGVLLHRGQVMLGNPLKALLCVGVAYFLIGVLIPVGALATQGNLTGFNQTGLSSLAVGGRCYDPPTAHGTIRSMSPRYRTVWLGLTFTSNTSVSHPGATISNRCGPGSSATRCQAPSKSSTIPA